MTDVGAGAALRARLLSYVERPGFQPLILAVILLNAITLVLETWPPAMRAAGPEWFGSVAWSFFTLFQSMTLEGWADIVRALMVTVPSARAFFVPFILIVTFTVLNLFIALVVSAMQSVHDAELAQESQLAQDEQSEILPELRELRREMRQLRGASSG